MKITKIFSILCALVFSGTLFLHAATYDIKQMTPAIKKALEGRQSRYAQLQNLKLQGKLGENNQGYVSILAGGGSADAVANSENSNRRVIYQAIVDQNNLGAGGLAIVQKIFAEEQRSRAPAGESIQQLSGAWTKK